MIIVVYPYFSSAAVVPSYRQLISYVLSVTINLLFSPPYSFTDLKIRSHLPRFQHAHNCELGFLFYVGLHIFLNTHNTLTVHL